MKNIAVINTCDFGSTGKIAKGLFQHLNNKGYNCIFVYGRGEKQNTGTIFRIEGRGSVFFHYVITRITGTDGYGSSIATRRLIRRLRKANADTIYIVSIHGHYLNEKKFFDYLIKDGIKIVYIMIDEYAYHGGCTYSGECQGYQQKCNHCPKTEKKLIARMFNINFRKYQNRYIAYRELKDPVFVGPEYTLISAAGTGLLDELDTKVVDEAINTLLYSPQDTIAFRKTLDIPKDKKIIVCVAPYSYARKGVRYYYDLADQMKDNDQYIFIHVGYDGKEKEFPNNMIVKGYESNQEILRMYYSLADLFVFPSLQDTMPNACLEALACGTPLLCFNTSGMPYIANDEVATFVEAGNVEQMKQAVLCCEYKTDESIRKCREYALGRYDSRDYFNKLEQIGAARPVKLGEDT